MLGGENNFQYATNPVGWVDPLGLSQFNVLKIVKKYGGKHLVDDYYCLPSKKNAKKAAAEIAGNLGSDRELTRKKDFRGGPKTWKKSNNKIGKTSRTTDKNGDPISPCSGWRDDSPGHSFDQGESGETIIPRHFNAWNKKNGVENSHLLYDKKLILNGKTHQC